MRAKPRRSWPLHLTLLRFVTLLVTTTATGIGLLTYFNTRRAVNVLAARLTHEVTERTRERSRDLLDRASHALQENREWITQDPVYGLFAMRPATDAAWRARAHWFLHLLRANPEFTMVHCGDRWNGFVGAVRDAGGRITATHRWIEPSGRARWQDYDDVDTLRNPHERARRFLATERPWYVAAQRAGRLAWSAPYLFAGTQTPGVTASLPILDRGGKLAGVLGIDFDLAGLDAFVRKLEKEHGYHVYLLAQSGQVVAQALPRSREAATGNLPRAAQSEDPLLRAAAALKTFQAEPITSPEALPTFQVGRARWIASTSAFSVGEGLTWRVVVILPEAQVMGVVYQNSWLTFVICIAVLAVSLGVGAFLSVGISRPLQAFAGEMRQVGDYIIPETPSPASPIEEVEQMGRALDRMKASLRSFDRYVPSEVVRLLHRQGQTACLGGETARLTLLFADVVGFSGIAEKTEPSEAVAALSQYLEAIEAVISRNGGIVDKFDGDSAVAFWGAPIHPRPCPERDACSAAVEIERAVSALSAQRRAQGQPALDIRIGVHTGKAVVGNIGSPQRMNYTAIGDAVNVASRLEGLNRTYGTKILVSQVTLKAVMEEVSARELDTVAVKGRVGSVVIYELQTTEMSPANVQAWRSYAEGLKLYRARDWSGALQCFQKGLEQTSDDGPCRIMIERCEQYTLNPPPAEWNGIYVATSK